MQIGELIRTAARQFGDAPALTCEGRTLSFCEFDRETDRLGNALLALGLVPGDRVAVLLPNGIECLITYYALAKNGLVRVPLNVRDAQKDHEYKLDYSGSRALIHGGGVELDIEFDIGPDDFTKMIESASDEPCAVDRDLEAPLRLGFTGGTTGKSKAVTLTTRGETAELANFMIDMVPNIQPGDTMLHAAPIAHASGAYFLPYLVRGARAFIMPHFDAARFLELAVSEKATATFLVPTMLAMILEQPGINNFSHNLNRIYYGASPIAPAVLDRAVAVFGSIFTQSYGQAESPMVITCLKPEDHDRIGSAGRAFTLNEVKIFDDDDKPLPPGEVGEIVCRGLQLMSHYWERPDETAHVFRNGWLHTGDVGTMDEDGFVYLLDRKNDLLISGGYNVYPREVEDVLLAVDGVVEAAVIGLDDEKWGDRVYAVIAGRAGLDADTVLKACEGHLSDYKKPRGIEIWDELPKSPAGKILRRSVREIVAAKNNQTQ